MITPNDDVLLAEKQFALQSKALSHPIRIRILSLLNTLEKQEGCLNNDLVATLGLAQSTVSEHLRILKNAEFISAEPMPPKVCYRLNKPALASFFNSSSLFDL
ncbi:metalloregulator ArsR/SmtB family transcription factor [Vibrio sp.]|nr:metalloregulator ArsR/SmtB family transcription factor [Vibrio sp.]